MSDTTFKHLVMFIVGCFTLAMMLMTAAKVGTARARAEQAMWEAAEAIEWVDFCASFELWKAEHEPNAASVTLSAKCRIVTQPIPQSED